MQNHVKKESRTRHQILKISLTDAGAIAAGTLGLPSLVTAGEDTVRVGHITPRSGFLGTLGNYGVRGVN